jgi:hypothetical protein
MPSNIRLLVCGLFVEVLTLTLIIARVATLGGVVTNVTDLMPEVGHTLKDAQTMLPDIVDTMKDLNELLPEVRKGLKILQEVCARINCSNITLPNY